MGRAGIVLGLEVSRLARNSADWHRLLEICALTSTLILDEDGIYDPAHFNDRLLLGLKGTMSEAELHVLRARLQGGILNKARRGELFVRPPMGFVYTAEGKLILDPDQQIQHTLRMVFETFHRTGSALATVKAFRGQGLLFPRRIIRGPKKAMYCGDQSNIVTYCESCITRAMRECSSSAEPARARPWREGRPSNNFRASSGTPFFSELIQVTSDGRNM